MARLEGLQEAAEDSAETQARERIVLADVLTEGVRDTVLEAVMVTGGQVRSLGGTVSGWAFLLLNADNKARVRNVDMKNPIQSTMALPLTPALQSETLYILKLSLKWFYFIFVFLSVCAWVHMILHTYMCPR